MAISIAKTQCGPSGVALGPMPPLRPSKGKPIPGQAVTGPGSFGYGQEPY